MLSKLKIVENLGKKI